MPCVLEKIVMAEISGYINEHVNIINVFPDVNLKRDQHAPQGWVY